MHIQIALLLITAFAVAAFAQEPAVSDIVDRAAARQAVYIGEFSNLISQENKTFEIYDKKGSIKKRRTVDSTFLVYRLSRDEKRVAEFRNVVSVDGTPLQDIDSRAEKLFESISKIESSRLELEKLQDESLRYDEELYITDLTLFQAVALAHNMRPYFEFRFERKDVADSIDVYVLSYRQTRESPYIFFDQKNQPAEGLSIFYDVGRAGRKSEPRLSGELWIDARTFDIRREIRTLTLRPIQKIAETEFKYQDSDFGIFTPKQIVHTQFRVDAKSSAAAKDVVVTFTYGKFTKPAVEVQSSEIKQ